MLRRGMRSLVRPGCLSRASLARAPRLFAIDLKYLLPASSSGIVIGFALAL